MVSEKVDIHLEPEEGEAEEFKKEKKWWFWGGGAKKAKGWGGCGGNKESKENLHPYLIPYTQKYLKMYYRSKYKIPYYRNSRRKHEKIYLTLD